MRPGDSPGAKPKGMSTLMKSILLSLLLVLCADFAFAGPIGRPAASGRTGATRYLFDLDLTERGLENEGPFGGDLDTTGLLSGAVWGINDRVDLIGRIGVAEAESGNRAFDGSWGPSLSGGLKLTVLRSRDFVLGFGAQAQTLYSRGSGKSLWLRELESSLGAEFRGVPFFAPYFGVTLSYVEAEVGGGGGKIKGGEIPGGFFGAEILIFDRWFFGAEARIANEQSMTLTLVYLL